MYIILVVLLVVLFGYSLMLVLANNSVVAVNLLLTQVPAMNLGLLLIVSLVLGVGIGMLIALIAFKVLPMRLEISRLKKEKIALQSKLDETNIALEQSRQGQSVLQTHSVVNDPLHSQPVVPQDSL